MSLLTPLEHSGKAHVKNVYNKSQSYKTQAMQNQSCIAWDKIF